MMVTVVALIAAMVAAFAYGIIIGNVSEVPGVALVEEGVGGGIKQT